MRTRTRVWNRENVLASLTGKSMPDLFKNEEHYNATVTLVSRIARRSGFRGQAFDQLVQDCLTHLWRNSYKANPDKPITPWISKIVRNFIIDSVRGENRNKKINQKPLTGAEVSKEHPILDILDRRQLLSNAISSIKSIPEMYRRPLIMFVNGKKYVEISSELGVPLGTVKSRIVKARKILAQRLRI